MQNIQSVRVRSVCVPMAAPHRTAGWIRAIALAQANSIPVSNHLFPEISAQLLCLLPTADWLEYSNWWNPILEAPLKIQDGMAIADTAPGTGVTWNEEAVERYSV
jgi:mandelate racemase